MPAPLRAVRPRRAAVRAAAYHWLEQIPFRMAVAVLAGVLVLIGCLTTGVIMAPHA